ncbi:MAG: tetratricopeptide repeat protein [Polyangiaceae bacterium]|nr:tetratricopeptide repeat protein [Polyangiaceae bacterium]
MRSRQIESGLRDTMNRDAQHWDAVEEAVDLLHEERFREALELLRDVLSKDGSNPYAFFFLGQGLYEVGEIAPARDAYRACLKLAPKHLGARIALCHVLRKLGDHREAIKQGMIALEQAPADSDALYAVGLAYLARGDDPAARRYLEAFLKTKPEFEVRLEVEALLERVR